jgi:hypothetical protein
MKAPAIAGVAGALALIFGAAVLVGSAFGPDRSARADTNAPHAEKEMEMTTTDPVRGLAVANRGLALQLAQTELDRGRPSTLRFRIAGPDGRPVRDFAVEHEKRMHLIVVRRDGQGFQHLHPTMDAAGTWSVPLTLAQAGAYRVFADFKHGDRAQTLAADLAVDGSADYEPLPAPATTATTQDGYEVSLDEQSVRAAAKPSCASPCAATGRSCTPSRTSEPAATWSRCARATSPTCTCTRATRPATPCRS